MNSLGNKKTKKETQKQQKREQAQTRSMEADRSAITGHKIEKNSSGANQAGAAVKPDMLRDDHPDLAK